MNLLDVRKCAAFYQENFLKKYYVLITYNRNGFVLVGEKKNFPHLVGIKKNVWMSNGYSSAGKL
ncbi:MAG: hypothetical protein J6I64_02015, partial [Lachnospiraceae bacterium]|nr:hypothetical protein [Lachnospiraceae bacterium]